MNHCWILHATMVLIICSKITQRGRALRIRWLLALLFLGALGVGGFTTGSLVAGKVGSETKTINKEDPTGVMKRSWPNTKWWFWTPGDTVDDSWPVPYQPKQPIAFSHKLHAGKMKMDCQYCHASARKSKSAGIPATESVCMGCHKVAATDREPIKWLANEVKEGRAIEWIKVHDLPDFVRFHHKPHVQAGVTCQECHGQVEEMEEVYQHAPLQMGWCLRCHQDRGAPQKCYTCHY